jgi:iron complex outermembrane receptor protein
MSIATPCQATRWIPHMLLSGLATLVPPVWASDNFLELPLEDLLKVEIRSASRKLQRVQDVAAAVTVISREDIARSGARSIPEALRLAPGVEVARIANNRWAVSIRGFNGRFAQKLLVLKDGRSIYSPLFSGVMWEAEDTIMSEIERIEVVRGASAAMWGSNAVNGVINIITRSAANTLGTEVVASSATDEPGALTLRHGFAVGDGAVRLAAKRFNLEPAKTSSGADNNDSWHAGRVDLRGDWPTAEGGRWILAADAHQTRADDRFNYTRYGQVPPVFDVAQNNSGSSLMLRREHPTANGGTFDWQVSAETSLIHVENVIREERTTLNAEVQQRLPMGAHDLQWGASLRLSNDDVSLTALKIFGYPTADRPQRDWRLVSVFAHDDYTLVPERWRLSGGARIDFDSWSGPQVQPDMRLIYTPDAHTTWWTSLARAARTPSRLERDVPFTLATTPGTPFSPTVITLRPAPAADSLKAETVTSLEAGWRSRLNASLSLDINAFVSDYSKLLATLTQPVQVIPPALVIVPLETTNVASARTHGFEVAADWQVSPGWRLQPQYSRLYLSSPRLADPAAAEMQSLWEGRVARHRWSLRSSWTLDQGQQLDLWLKYTSALSNPAVPGYTTLDLRYAMPLGPKADLAIIGQNLLGSRHIEFVHDYLPTEQSEMGRSVMVKATWHF